MEQSLPTERAPLLAIVGPGALTVGVKTSPWVDASTCRRLLVVLATGTLGAAATIDCKLQSADNGAGANAQDVLNASFGQTVKASGDNTRRLMQLDTQAINLPEKRKRFVRIVLTIAGATSEAMALLQGFDPVNQVQPALDATTLEVVTLNYPGY